MFKTKLILSTILTLFAFSNSYANNQQNNQSLNNQTQQMIFKEGRDPSTCWDEAAKYQNIDPWLLYAIGFTESSHNPSVRSKQNRNGTYDIGLMQINSVHLKDLKKYGITENMLYDGCTSIYVGAWILSSKIRRYGYSWESIASYNTGSVDNPRTRDIGLKYAQKVYRNYDRFKSEHRRKNINSFAKENQNNFNNNHNHNNNQISSSAAASASSN